MMNAPTSSLVNQFPYGRFYLVKGRPDLLWFLLRNEVVSYYYAPSLQEILLHSSAWGYQATYMIVVPNPKELVELKETIPSEDVRVFFVLSDLEGNNTKDAEKVYKSLAGAQFVQVDLNNYGWQLDPEVITALSTVDERSRARVLSDFNNPISLLNQLRSGDPLDYELPQSTQTKIEDLLSTLGTVESFKTWDLTKQDLYKLVLSPDRTRCGMYLVLVGGAKGGLCPSLWAYLNLFLERCASGKRPIDPASVVQLFVRWVYVASTALTTSTEKGFYVSISGSRKYYNFQPSAKAWKLLEELVSFDFLIADFN